MFKIIARTVLALGAVLFALGVASPADAATAPATMTLHQICEANYGTAPGGWGFGQGQPASTNVTDLAACLAGDLGSLGYRPSFVNPATGTTHRECLTNVTGSLSPGMRVTIHWEVCLLSNAGNVHRWAGEQTTVVQT